VLAVDAYIPGDNQRDPVIGKLPVKISELETMSFSNPDGDDYKLDLNWKCPLSISKY
jgi:hypothetical protein